MNRNEVNVLTQRSESVISTHKVLRNTYLLLGFTFLFSALTAYIAYATGVKYVNPFIMLLGAWGLIMLTQATRNSIWGLASVFALTGFLGYTLGPIIGMYLQHYSNGAQLVATSLGGTGIIFFALSGYVLTTKKDFSYLAGFIAIGFAIAILASIAGLIFQMPALQLAISAGVILLASGSILFQTSEIIHGGETNYIMATVSLFLSIYNLFLSLLNILGALSGRD